MNIFLMHILYDPVNTSLWNWTENVIVFFWGGQIPEKATRNVTDQFRTYYTILLGTSQICRQFSKLRRRLSVWGIPAIHCVGPQLTCMYPYADKRSVLQDTALTCWETFMINTQTGNANKTNGAHHAMQCSHVLVTLFNWQKLLLTGGCLCEPNSSVKMQAW